MAKNCHSHNTRRAAKNHLQIPSSNTKFGMRTFAYRASKLWNDLPNEYTNPTYTSAIMKVQRGLGLGLVYCTHKQRSWAGRSFICRESSIICYDIVLFHSIFVYYGSIKLCCC